MKTIETKKPDPNPITKRRTTGIEWTDHTWNPFLGCSIKSAGCQNCYAMALAYRLEKMGNAHYAGLTKNVKGKTIWTGQVAMNSKNAILKPHSISTPSIFFVNSMSDFFHANATDAMRFAAFSVMDETPRHQYQILTKRPEAILEFLERTKYVFPRNVWIGATVENSAVAERIEMIRKVPAAIKFLSVEPLIAPLGQVDLTGIDWVITGGESGPGARPMELEWMREVRDLCLKYRVPHFFKQWGHERNNPLYARGLMKLDPVGKGGSLLDGVSWKEMPREFEVANF